MGGKGGDSGGSQQQQTYEEPATEGGWSWADGTTGTPKKEEEKKTETPKAAEPKPITEGTPEFGKPTRLDISTPGYAGKNTNLSPLGDALVTGMVAEPGKPFSPKAPQQYVGQV